MILSISWIRCANRCDLKQRPSPVEMATCLRLFESLPSMFSSSLASVVHAATAAAIPADDYDVQHDAWLVGRAKPSLDCRAERESYF